MKPAATTKRASPRRAVIEERTVRTPDADYAIAPPTVRDLLRDQHADLADLPIRALDAGWDNAMFRLGDTLLVRLPRRAPAAALLEREQTWLPYLAPQLPLPVPAPVRIGHPGRGYPWRWSVVDWHPGSPADRAEVHPGQADALVDFLRTLHRPAPANTPVHTSRGVPLARQRARTEERLAALPVRLAQAARPVWERALAAPPARDACLLHGDLHPRNVIVQNGVLAAVIDWGDLCAGDVATDLASLWMLFDDARARARALARYGPTPATLDRALGWAVVFGALLGTIEDDVHHRKVGRATLQRLAGAR